MTFKLFAYLLGKTTIKKLVVSDLCRGSDKHATKRIQFDFMRLNSFF